MVEKSDLLWRGSAVMPDDDTPTGIGGAIDLSRKVTFHDVSGTVQAVSSAAGDTTQTITVHGRNSAGTIVNVGIALNGLTAVTNAQVFAQLLKAVKSATCAGDVAVEAQSAERTGTAQAGTAGDITLDAGASAVDGAYEFMVIRLTGGTGAGQIREVMTYTGADKKVVPSRAWTVTPDNTTTFRISKGMVFDLLPDEIDEVRRPFYDAEANPPGGGAVDYFEKIFLKNTNGTDTLLTASVLEALDPSGQVTFALETAVDGTGTNGANNRKVAPSSGVSTFDSAEKAVPGDELAAGERIGVWLKLSLGEGDPALSDIYVPRGRGTTS